MSTTLFLRLCSEVYTAAKILPVFQDLGKKFLFLVQKFRQNKAFIKSTIIWDVWSQNWLISGTDLINYGMILPRIGMCFTNGYHIPKDVWSLPFKGSDVIDYGNHISCTYKYGSFMHFHKGN